MEFKIDVVSDVVCPWCYVGKRRLEKAINQSEGYTFKVDYKPFQLNPNPSNEGQDTLEYLEQKYGGKEVVENMQNRLVAVAKDLGINMDFSKGQKVINTIKSHAILESLNVEERAILNEAFLAAYFEEGADLGDVSVLMKIAQENGVEIPEDFDAVEMIKKASQTELRFKQLGVTAVPTFIINDKYMIQGAQSEEALINAFQQIKSELETVSDGKTCEPGGGCC